MIKFQFINTIYNKYRSLSKRTRDSILIAGSLVGTIATILTILGISFITFGICNIWVGICTVIIIYSTLFIIIYIFIGAIFKNSLNIEIRKTNISIECGNIFSTPGMKVIGCDSHFSTVVDDIVISKGSLHGQLVLEHGDKNEIDKTVANAATQVGLHKNSNGVYDFNLGTIIPYHSSVDKNTYLMLAMAELNPLYETHTNMAQYEMMLMKMWKEIDRVYAGKDVALPILGAGISRFDDGPKDNDELLRCMLCTLNSSGVTLKSKIKIILYGDKNNISLYEYKDLFHSIHRK